MDTDGDGLPDWFEQQIIARSPGNNFTTATLNGATPLWGQGYTAMDLLTLQADSDGDFMPDGWEINNGLNPDLADAGQDPDRDGFTNLEEYQGESSPQNEEDAPANVTEPKLLCREARHTITLPGKRASYVLWPDYLLPEYYNSDLDGVVQYFSATPDFPGTPDFSKMKPVFSASGGSTEWRNYDALNNTAQGRIWFRPADMEGAATLVHQQVSLRAPARPVAWQQPYLITITGSRKLLQTVAGTPGGTILDYPVGYQFGVFEFAPKKSLCTNPVLLRPQFTLTPAQFPLLSTLNPHALGGDNGEPYEETSWKLTLIPMEVAPDLLQVNADFDEAQINPNTGRPQPDCDNNTLIAYKKLPWTSQVLGNAVFDELHEGWFGVSPSTLEPSFYSGASVKIAKIIQTDPDTGANESGHVRLWITAGSGTTLQEWKVDPYDRNAPAFTPTELVGVVYGPNASIPTSGYGTGYWIEGIKAGKCTLEFTYTKGATNFKHRQTFEVGCQWTPTQWKEVVRQHVYIESDHSRGGPGADMAGLDIALGFMPNRDRCRAVYQYYGSLFLDRPDEFHWLGLAKRAGASVYWGFSDSQYAIETWPTSAIPATVQTANSFQQALLRGMRDIFDDIGWQFMAYHVGGVKSMRYLRQQGVIGPDYLAAWNQMAEGYSQNQPGLVDQASRIIAEQEQRIVLAPSFSAVAAITTLGVPLSWILSKFSVNPVPGGIGFSQFNPQASHRDCYSI